LRVALLTPSYWPEVFRGTERVVHDTAAGLRRRGHDPRILTSHRGRPQRAREAGVPVVRHWRPGDGPLRRRAVHENLTHLPFAYASLAGGNDDVAHAFHLSDALAAVRWSTRRRRPAVYTCMGVPRRAGIANRALRPWLVEEVISASAAVVTLSRAAQAACLRWMGVESEVIHPGVDLSAFAMGGERFEDPTFFCPADLADPRKDAELVLTAFRLAKGRRSRSRLVVFEPSDRMLARRLAIEPGVDFVVREELAATFGASWVTVLASREEAFGLVMVESLAAGTPVVGPGDAGVAEIVDGPAIGRLFTEFAPAVLAEAMLDALELVEAPETRAVCRARAEDFSLERSLDAHEALYRRLLEIHGT
jgi:phosphatidylinositol alpha-mannosyltransferase